MSALHASAIALPDGAVLLTGAAGSGKSSLLARLMESHEGQLIADDRVEMTVDHHQLIAAAPRALQGLMELRGLGIMRRPAIAAQKIDLVVALVAREKVPRVAEADYFEMKGIKIPRLHLHAFDMATPLVICEALRHLPRSGFQQTGQYEAEETK